jgi:hypothetical protein
MERINYLESAAPGLYFFNINFTPSQRIYTAFIKSEAKTCCEVSVHFQNSLYNQDSMTFFLAFNNSCGGDLKQVLGKSKSIASDTFFKHNKFLSPTIDSDGIVQTSAFINGLNLKTNDTHWNQLKALFPELKTPEKSEQSPIEFIACIVQAMASSNFETQTTFLQDLQGFCSFAAKAHLKNNREKVNLSRIKYIDKTLSNVIAETDITSLRLNGISELGYNEAIGLGSVRELFLDSLKSISIECANNLCNANLTYISLKAVKTLSADVLDIFKKNEVFVSAKETKNESEVTTYSKEIIENSIVSKSKEFGKLKNLLLNPNKDIVESGISILASYSDDPYLFDTLLEKVEIKNGVFNVKELGKGLKIEPALLNYIVTAILFHAGPEATLAQQIKQNTQTVNLEISNLSYLHCFNSLESLTLQDPNGLIKNLNQLDPNMSLKKIDISECGCIEDIERISNYPIESFKLKRIKRLKSFLPLRGKVDKDGTTELMVLENYYLENLDGIEFYQSLENLIIDDCPLIKNVRALGGIKSLKNLSTFDRNITLNSCGSDRELFICSGDAIGLEIDEWNNPEGIGSETVTSININCRGMQNLDWLKGYPNLNHLNITCKSLYDVSGLQYVPKLKTLGLYRSDLTELKGVEKLNNLEKITISECHDLTEIKECESLNSIKDISVSNCAKLESLEGLTKNKIIAQKTTVLGIKKLPSLRKLGDLSNFQQLREIKFYDYFNSEVLQDATTSKSLNLLYFYSCDIDIKYAGEVNCKFVFECCSKINFNGSKIKEIEIVNSSITDLKGLGSLEELHSLKLEKNYDLETLEGLKNLPKLQVLKLNKNLLLHDISSLTGFPQLVSIQLSNLDTLKNVSALAKLENLETLDIVDCEFLEVKPRPSGLIQKEKLFSYQLKLAEFYKLDTKNIKEKVAKNKANPEATTLKKQIPKIKKLLQERNYESIDLGLSILESLEDETLIDSLLAGIEYQKDRLIPNKIFKGTSPAQPYLNYALFSVLKLARKIPKWEAFIQTIVALKLETEKFAGIDHLSNLHSLSIADSDFVDIEINLPNLKRLILSNKIYWGDHRVNLDILKNCPKLEYLDAKYYILSNGFNGIKELTNLKTLLVGRIAENTITDLKELSQLKNLEVLKIDSATVINSIKGIENCTELKILEFNRLPFSDSKPLANLSKLEEIKIFDSEITRLELAPEVLSLKRIDVSHNNKLKEISDSLFSETIASLNLTTTATSSFPSLRGVKTLEDFSCGHCPELIDLKGLKQIETLGSSALKMHLDNCPNLQDFNDILHLNPIELSAEVKKLRSDIPKNTLKKLELRRIDDLTGIEQFPELEYLVLYGAELKSLLPLKNLKKLRRLSLKENSGISSLDGIEHLPHLDILDVSQMDNLKDVKALDNMQIDELYIAKCFLKKADFQAHLQDNINWQSTIPSYQFFSDNWGDSF